MRRSDLRGRIDTDYIGRLTLQSIRKFILERKLSREHVIVLHQIDFDNLALEYRELYRRSLQSPYVMMGVRIVGVRISEVPPSRIGVMLREY